MASVDVVGESIVIRLYEGGNISLKATLAASRYFITVFACCLREPTREHEQHMGMNNTYVMLKKYSRTFR